MILVNALQAAAKRLKNVLNVLQHVMNVSAHAKNIWNSVKIKRAKKLWLPALPPVKNV